MHLLNSIKIDKIKLIYNKQNISLKDRNRIHDKLMHYFPEAVVGNKAGKILSRFTPTKMSRSGFSAQHNLQMPQAKEFLEALKDITLHKKKIRNHIWISEIHISKDIILQEPVGNYLNMLSAITYNNLVAKLIGDDSSPEALYLHYKHNSNSNTDIKFKIKLYDKKVEYIKRHKTSIITLYEAISEVEINELGEAYNKISGTIDISKLNWLRIELELHETKRILPLTTLLSDGIEHFLLLIY